MSSFDLGFVVEEDIGVLLGWGAINVAQLVLRTYYRGLAASAMRKIKR